MADSQWVLDTTDETFEADVFARSELGLVVVDFWAEWCAPCRMLAPVLEDVADAADGRFMLVKANTDQNPAAAGQFQVQGIPAVFAVLDRQVIHGFNQALPKDQVEAWLDELYPIVAIFEAKKLADTDPIAAEAKLKESIDGKHADAAKITLADLYLSQERYDECGELIAQLEERDFLEPEAQKIKATLAIKSKSIDGSNIDALREAANSDSMNFDAQFQLAEALVGQEAYQEAFDICLALVEQDKPNYGEKSRELMVQVFQALPADSDLVSDYRRKLSMLLY